MKQMWQTVWFNKVQWSELW